MHFPLDVLYHSRLHFLSHAKWKQNMTYFFVQTSFASLGNSFPVIMKRLMKLKFFKKQKGVNIAIDKMKIYHKKKQLCLQV